MKGNGINDIAASAEAYIQQFRSTEFISRSYSISISKSLQENKVQNNGIELDAALQLSCITRIKPFTK